MSANDDRSRSALAGIRVADFSRVLAGPYATMMLADFGADVIKIESPLGDDTRAWVPPVDDSGMSTYFGGLNRNKRSVVCDLRTESGLAEARRLAESADVVVENFRDGVMAKFGLDEPTVRAANPGVVYCSITGFGRGDGAALAGYDLLVQAVGGLMSITGEPEGEPSKVGVALVDVLTGLNAFSGILLALRAREAGGYGDRVDVDLLTTLLSALTNQAASTLATGVQPRRLGNAHPSIAPYEVFAAADRRLVIAVGNDRQFAAFVALLGSPELASDERFATNAARVEHRELLRATIETRLLTDNAAAWVGACAAVGIPAGLVNTIAEAFEFADALGLDPVADLTGDTSGGGIRTSRQVSNPIHLSSNPPHYRGLPPTLGEHDGADWHPLAQDPPTNDTLTKDPSTKEESRGDTA
jgi:crotonobetainyl-CoA:carnitine CoA-transferase CaiB-like acyl-CoA transferase